MSTSSVEIKEVTTVGEGDILVPLRMIANSAELLERKSPELLNAGYLFDFCSFINALALHKRFITLPVASIDKAQNTGLFRYLLERDILKTLDKSRIDHTLRKGGRNMVEELFGEKISDARMECINDDELKYYLDDEQKISDEERNAFIDEATKLREWNTNSVDILYGRDQFNIRALKFRTALYYDASTTLELPFIPDFTRIPILLRYPNKVQQSLGTELETKVYEELKKTILRNTGQLRITLPFSSPVSYFLQQYSEPNTDVHKVLDGLIKHYESERQKIIRWDSKLKEYKITNRHQKAQSFVNDLLESLKEDSRSAAKDLLKNICQFGVSIAPVFFDASSGYLDLIQRDTLAH